MLISKGCDLNTLHDSATTTNYNGFKADLQLLDEPNFREKVPPLHSKRSILHKLSKVYNT